MHINAYMVLKIPYFTKLSDRGNRAGRSICWYSVKRPMRVSLRIDFHCLKGCVIALQQEMLLDLAADLSVSYCLTALTQVRIRSHTFVLDSSFWHATASLELQSLGMQSLLLKMSEDFCGQLESLWGRIIFVYWLLSVLRLSNAKGKILPSVRKVCSTKYISLDIMSPSSVLHVTVFMYSVYN